MTIKDIEELKERHLSNLWNEYSNEPSTLKYNIAKHEITKFILFINKSIDTKRSIMKSEKDRVIEYMESNTIEYPIALPFPSNNGFGEILFLSEKEYLYWKELTNDIQNQ